MDATFRPRLTVLLTGLLAAAALTFAPSALADHPSAAYESDSSSYASNGVEADYGSSTYEQDVATLGPEHAAQHAFMRKAARANARAGTEAPQVTPPNAVTNGEPVQVGRWTDDYFDLPNFAIHAALLPTGKVMFWGYPNFEIRDGKTTRDNFGEAAIWNPKKGTGPSSITIIEPPRIADWNGDGFNDPTPIYCSGQSFLANGELLLAGGNLVWPEQTALFSDFAGIKQVFSFDPFTESWTQQPDMEAGRWYPSQVMLADGRTVLVGGFTDAAPGKQYTNDVEVFTPGPVKLAGAPARGQVGSIVNSESASRTTANYPHLFTLPGGNVLMAGPNQYGDTARLNPNTMTWKSLGAASRSRSGGNGILLPDGPAGSDTVVQIGGFDGAKQGPEPPATATSEVISGNATTPAWKTWSQLRIGRSYANTVILPDTSLVAIGGGTGYTRAEGSWVTDTEAKRRQLEIWDPATQAWKLGPSQREDRSYHSTALLLPDATVFSAGDDHHPYTPEAPKGFSPGDTAEIYKPPYFYRSGARPVITSSPKRLRYGDNFGVGTENGAGDKAILIAPGATTHGNDMAQRAIPLKKISKISGKGMNFKSPADPTIAPPGYYMLFVTRGNGKPSVAAWIRLDPGAPKASELRARKRSRRG